MPAEVGQRSTDSKKPLLQGAFVSACIILMREYSKRRIVRLQPKICGDYAGIFQKGLTKFPPVSLGPGTVPLACVPNTLEKLCEPV